MSKLFKGLKKGLEEAAAYADGKITLASELLEIPEPPEEYSPSKGLECKCENCSVLGIRSPGAESCGFTVIRNRG